MPKVGLKYAVFAPIQAENPMAKPTYGKGVVLGRMMAANVRFTVSNAKQYSDDALSDVDRSVTGGTIELTVNDIQPQARVEALGIKQVEEDGGTTYRTTGDPAPYGGVGYIQVRKQGEKLKFLPTWVYKTAFAPADQELKTKGENTEFQSETVKGDMMGIEVDESGTQTFCDDREYPSFKEAKAWIDKMANMGP